MSTPCLLLCPSALAAQLRPTLSALPVDLHHAESLVDAQEILQAHRPTLVLTTLSTEALHLIRGGQRATLVILGPDEPATARRVLRAGASDWLTLPLRASEVQRMFAMHSRQREAQLSSELLTARAVLNAVHATLDAPKREQRLRSLTRAGRILLREQDSAGNVLAGLSAAAQLAEAATSLRVSVQGDPSMPRVPLSTPRIGRALLQLLLSAHEQGASSARMTAILLRDQVQIDLSNDAPLVLGTTFSMGNVNRLVQSVGGRVELTSTSGAGIQVQITLPVQV